LVEVCGRRNLLIPTSPSRSCPIDLTSSTSFYPKVSTTFQLHHRLVTNPLAHRTWAGGGTTLKIQTKTKISQALSLPQQLARLQIVSCPLDNMSPGVRDDDMEHSPQPTCSGHTMRTRHHVYYLTSLMFGRLVVAVA
jgi:hypothetical protein